MGEEGMVEMAACCRWRRLPAQLSHLCTVRRLADAGARGMFYRERPAEQRLLLCVPLPEFAGWLQDDALLHSVVVHAFDTLQFAACRQQAPWHKTQKPALQRSGQFRPGAWRSCVAHAAVSCQPPPAPGGRERGAGLDDSRSLLQRHRTSCQPAGTRRSRHVFPGAAG